MRFRIRLRNERCALMRQTVSIIQPGIPRYREPFFEELRRGLQSEGVDLKLYVGGLTREAAARRDHSSAAAHGRLRTVRCQLPKFSLSYKFGLRGVARGSDMLILEHGSSILENYPMLASGRRPKVGLWGHGGAFVSNGSKLDLRLERWQVDRAEWYFAYTAQGASRILNSSKIDRERVSVVNNSSDTLTLNREYERWLNSSQTIRRSLGLPNRAFVCLYVGGLDEAKGFKFLLDVADEMCRQNPDFHLLVAGRGPSEGLLHASSCRLSGRVHNLGYADRSRLAQLGAVSDIMLLPGRVGLAAVDSFVLGTPIVTKVSRNHAPEFSYLSPGEDSVVTGGTVKEYCEAIALLMRDGERLRRMKVSCRQKARRYSVESMVQRFREGIVACLDLKDR